MLSASKDEAVFVVCLFVTSVSEDMAAEISLLDLARVVVPFHRRVLRLALADRFDFYKCLLREVVVGNHVLCNGGGGNVETQNPSRTSHVSALAQAQRVSVAGLHMEKTAPRVTRLSLALNSFHQIDRGDRGQLRLPNAMKVKLWTSASNDYISLAIEVRNLTRIEVQRSIQ